MLRCLAPNHCCVLILYDTINKIVFVRAEHGHFVLPQLLLLLLKDMYLFNPYLTNGFSHHYQLDESTFISRDVRCDF